MSKKETDSIAKEKDQCNSKHTPFSSRKELFEKDTFK
jgi:hypothetical protein